MTGYRRINCCFTVVVKLKYYSYFCILVQGCSMSRGKYKMRMDDLRVYNRKGSKT